MQGPKGRKVKRSQDNRTSTSSRRGWKVDNLFPIALFHTVISCFLLYYIMTSEYISHIYIYIYIYLYVSSFQICQELEEGSGGRSSNNEGCSWLEGWWECVQLWKMDATSNRTTPSWWLVRENRHCFPLSSFSITSVSPIPFLTRIKRKKKKKEDISGKTCLSKCIFHSRMDKYSFPLFFIFCFLIWEWYFLDGYHFSYLLYLGFHGLPIVFCNLTSIY